MSRNSNITYGVLEFCSLRASLAPGKSWGARACTVDYLLKYSNEFLLIREGIDIRR